ncbi:MAG TPA: 2-oxoacid:acceptor oxidoreductase subunit alpha, partial [Syntrophobacteria bacterium]|nr:2-oxoacid:acceptor oxidoreductase subunit alpha [Syntrophobacteria bacterium]
VSPRLLPGVTRHLVVVDSDEHTEDGHITEDLTVRKVMVEKRLRKGRELKAEVVPPALAGDGKPDLLLVCWGSTKGAVDEAAAKLRAGGARVATLHFSQIWPLVPEQFLPHLEQAPEVVGVESNAFGQFARLIRRETGFAIQRQVLRYDGLPMTPEFILGELKNSRMRE